jgi:hypothetical protein
VEAPTREWRRRALAPSLGERVSDRFRDRAQQQVVCDRILRLAHDDLETVRSERLQIGDVVRVRRAGMLYDLALALWDGDRQVALGPLVDRDRDTRTVIGDLLAELAVADHRHIDRWLASTDTVFEDGAWGTSGDPLGANARARTPV